MWSGENARGSRTQDRLQVTKENDNVNDNANDNVNDKDDDNESITITKRKRQR